MIPDIPSGWIIVLHGNVKPGDRVLALGKWVDADALDIGRYAESFEAVIRKAS